MKFIKTAPIAFVLMAFLVGCGSDGNSGTDSANPPSQKKTPAQVAADYRAEHYDGTPAPKSKFAKVKMDMSIEEVTALIGQPTSQSSHTTGKAWIPFFHGSDTYRREFYYKGEGNLSFSPAHPGDSVMSLIHMTVDTNATGYPPTD